MPPATTEDARPLQPGTAGFWVLDHLPLIYALTLEPRGPVVPVECAIGRGFHQDLYTGYRAPCLVRDAHEAEARARAGLTDEILFPYDQHGRYHLGFVLQDAPGEERLRVEVGGRELGRMSAVHGDMRSYLYLSRQPVRLGRDRPVRLVAETREGVYRIEGMLLLEELPELRAASPPRVRELEARPAWLLPGRADYDRPGGADTLVTWWTDRLSRCQVALGTEAGRPEPLAGGETRAISHRLVLSKLVAGQRYHLQVSGETDRDERLEPAVLSFVAGEVPEQTGPGQPAGRDVPELTITTRRAGEAGTFEKGDGGEGDRAALAWPLTFGIPLPPGLILRPDQAVLHAGGGTAVPLQRQVTARWPDGSIRWLLADLQTGVGGSGSWRLRVSQGEAGEGGEAGENGATPAGRPGDDGFRVVVTDRVDAVKITTGALSCEVPRWSAGIIGQVQVRGADGEYQPLSLYGLKATVVRHDGRTYTAEGPDRVTVEAAGPLRATVHVVGGHVDHDGARLGTYHCRIHAYAGQPWLRLSWTFENDWTQDDMVALKRVELALSSAFQPPYTARLGTEQGPVTLQEGAGRVELHQLRPEAYTGQLQRDDGEPEALAGRRAPGWAELLGDGGSLGVAMADFWQRYPGGLRVSGGGVRMALLPELPPDAYDDQRDGDAAHRLYYHIRGGRYHLRQGVSFTKELLVSFALPGASPAAETLAGVLADPPVAVLPAAWYGAAGAWLWYSDTRGPASRAYDEAADEYRESFLHNQEALQAYGFLNYGDWWGERRINWGNCEYDTARGFLTHFMRSGDPRFLALGRAANRHHRDVDTVHHHADPRRVGAVCAHAIGHTGGYFAEGELEAPGGNYEPWDTISHTWVEGHLLSYFLTGDRRSLEIGERVGRRYAGQELPGLKFENGRNPGWNLILTAAMYHATLDPFYLNSSRWIVEQVLASQTPDGGWRRQLRPGHCHCLPRHTGNAGFMIGVLLYGLYAHFRSTGDPRLPPAMARAARYLLDEMWGEETASFSYTSCPATEPPLRVDFRPTGGVALAYRVSGDEELGRVLMTVAQKHLVGETNSLRVKRAQLDAVGAVGKGISVTMWFAPAALAVMDELAAREA